MTTITWKQVQCPTCGAKAGEPCVSCVTGNPVKTHRARIARADRTVECWLCHRPCDHRETLAVAGTTLRVCWDCDGNVVRNEITALTR